MSAQQPDAMAFNPNNLKLTRVASYARNVDAPVVRVWENVLDWEHLPHLHNTSFDYVELDSAGEWGWRTWSNPAHTDHIELTLSNNSRYVARTYQSGQQVSEIWTTVTEQGPTTDILVEFHLPNIEPSAATKLGELMTQLYTRLWDEDEAMMRGRHIRLLEIREDADSVDLGEVSAIKQRLQDHETITFQLRKREFQLRWHNNNFLAHPTICPHLMGPLTDSNLSEGTLRCPWHGYQFDLTNGQCISPASATCQLPESPTLDTSSQRMIASLR